MVISRMIVFTVSVMTPEKIKNLNIYFHPARR